MTLIVLGGSLTALSIVRNASDLGYKVILLCSGNEVAIFSRTVAKRYICTHTKGALSIIENLEREPGQLAVIATSDQWLRFVVQNRAALESLEIDIIQPSNQTVLTCLDKHLFNQWAEMKGFPIPKQISARLDQNGRVLGIDDDISYPLFVRPAQSQHGNSERIVDKALSVANLEQLENTLRHFAEAKTEAIITESLLPLNPMQYSVGMARSSSGICSFVAEKLRPGANHASVGTYVALSPSHDVDLLARKVLAALDYYGIAEVEILKDPETGELYLIEVNARPWLQYELARRSGHNLLKYLLEPDSYQASNERKVGVAWIDFNSDFFSAFSSSIGLVRNKEISIRDYALSLLQANAFARFQLNDLLPWYRGIVDLLKLFSGRG